MLERNDTCHLYEFLCLSCPDPVPFMIGFQGLNDIRPTCVKCHTFMVPNLEWFRNLPNKRMTDLTITPDVASDWLDNGFTSFREQMSEATIQSYTVLMQTNRWVDATRVMGGYWCPIVRIQQTLMLGFNRLQACVNSGHAFTNTVIEVV